MTIKSIVKTNFPRLFSVAKKVVRKIKKHTVSEDIDTQHLLHLAKVNGLFDLEWYSVHQQRTFGSELEAFKDYLHKGCFSNINPSPAFDSETYYKANVDIYHAGINPLVHFIQSGSSEGRVSAPAIPRWAPLKTISTTTDCETPEFTIAVCLHVFYEDFIDYYAKCLKDFPTNVDVFVSIAKPEIEKLVDEKIAILSTVNKVTTKVVPNHGRNFGPMLVEFAQDLQNYDLFCHLHSKKSLYSGRQQTQWADYLGEYLLNDKHVIKQVLNQFETDPTCGIYYPTSFWMMPNWVNHWLKNKPFTSKMERDWGIEINNDFLPYPAGGMFWARPTALKQLLDKKYSYEDFPGEPLPNDGSELHALERGLGLLAEKNGFKQLFYYPTLGRFTYDQSFIFSNYQNSAEGILNQLSSFNTLSFDVFDTLLRRSHFVPDYAKLLLGKKLVKQGLVKDAHQFVKDRNKAEFNVRKLKNFKGDVTIYETYENFSEHLKISLEEAKVLADTEFSLDLNMVESKNEMVDVINHFILNGKKVIIASDTYYTAKQVTLMLKKIGVATGYQLIVSSETGLRKDNGTMWKYFKEKIEDVSSFIHIGDNAVADSQVPGDFGFNNFHILNPLDKWHAAGLENPFSGGNALNEKQILKWGPLVSQFGRFPFLGE